MTTRFSLFAFVLAALLISLQFAASTSAHAQGSPEWQRCSSPGTDYDDIIETCTLIIRAGGETTSNQSIAYNNRGNAFLNKKDIETAVRDFDEAIRIDRRNAQAFTNRGEAYQRKGNYEKAISDHTEAIRIDDKHPDAWFNRGIAYHNMGNNERAIADYRQALKVNPKDEDARRQLRSLGATE